MVIARLEPLLRNEGVVKVARDDGTFQKDKPYIVLSRRHKIYSFMVKLLDVQVEEGLVEPVLVMDSRRTGILGSGDQVEIEPWALPEAREITIVISENHRTITPGSWTGTILPQIKGRTLDLGDPVNFGMEVGGRPKIIQGTLLDSGFEPQTPVVIGDLTRVALRKLPDAQIADFAKKVERDKSERARHWEVRARDIEAETDRLAEKQRETRARELEEGRRKQQELVQNMIAAIKTRGTQDRRTVTFENVTSVKALASSVSRCFEGLESLENGETVHEDEHSYTASRSYYIREGELPVAQVMYMVTRHGEEVSVMLQVWAMDEGQLGHFLNQYQHTIQELGGVHKEKAREREQQKQAAIEAINSRGCQGRRTVVMEDVASVKALVASVGRCFQGLESRDPEDTVHEDGRAYTASRSYFIKEGDLPVAEVMYTVTSDGNVTSVLVQVSAVDDGKVNHLLNQYELAIKELGISHKKRARVCGCGAKLTFDKLDDDMEFITCEYCMTEHRRE